MAVVGRPSHGESDRFSESGTPADGNAVSLCGRLLLTIHCGATHWGESVALVGEGPALRDWGAAAGGPLRLRCVDPASGTCTWPRWTLEEPLLVAVGQGLEYKYLIHRGGERPKWESRKVGENRRLVVDANMLQAGLHDDGEFGRIVPAVAADDSPGPSAAPAPGSGTEMTGDRCATDELPDATMPAYKRLRRIGKGKQGRCYLVELEDGTSAVLKELRGGGRHAFRAEAIALARLRESAAVAFGAVPRLLGAAAGPREVLMSHFCGTPAPEGFVAPALQSPAGAVAKALQCWLDISGAVQEANSLGLIHCDVNPWNILVAAPHLGEAPTAGSGLGYSTHACLVDWACARSPSEMARGLPFKRRGDFQPPELLDGRVGVRTDVYGCAATLLWLLTRRTCKGLPDRSPGSLAAYFAAEAEASGCEAIEEAALAELARTCCWGLEEVWEDRCPELPVLREGVAGVLAASALSRASG